MISSEALRMLMIALQSHSVLLDLMELLSSSPKRKKKYSTWHNNLLLVMSFWRTVVGHKSPSWHGLVSGQGRLPCPVHGTPVGHGQTRDRDACRDKDSSSCTLFLWDGWRLKKLPAAAAPIGKMSLSWCKEPQYGSRFLSTVDVCLSVVRVCVECFSCYKFILEKTARSQFTDRSYVNRRWMFYIYIFMNTQKRKLTYINSHNAHRQQLLSLQWDELLLSRWRLLDMAV